MNRNSTELRVIDPEDDEPLLTLSESNSAKIEQSADRLTVAQALGIVGLSEVAIEIALPADILSSNELLRPTEAKRASSSRDAQYKRTAYSFRI